MIWKLISMFFLARAASRGPDYLAGYLVRRQIRRSANRAAWRATRTWR